MPMTAMTATMEMTSLTSSSMTLIMSVARQSCLSPASHVSRLSAVR